MKMGSLTVSLRAGHYVRVRGSEFWVRRGNCKVTVTAPKCDHIERGVRDNDTSLASIVRSVVAGVVLFAFGGFVGSSTVQQQRLQDSGVITEGMPVGAELERGGIPAVHQQFQPGVGQRDVWRVIDRDRKASGVEQVEMILKELRADRHRQGNITASSLGQNIVGQVEFTGGVRCVDGFQNTADHFVRMCSHGNYPIGGVRGERQQREYRPMGLHVYASDDDEPANPATVTLRDAFEAYLYPSLDGRRAKKTTQGYRTAITHWETFVATRCRESFKRGSTTSTPALPSVPLIEPIDLVSHITDQMLNDWGAWLMAENGAKMSVDTAGKQWRHVRAILRRCGPRESGNPRALGYLDRVPTMDPLSELVVDVEDHEGPQDVTDEQLGRIYNACEIASWPRSDAVLQWRTYLVILSVMGPRVNDAATLTADNFCFDVESPVKRSARTYDHGWLIYRPTKTRTKKPAKLIVPLPPCVAAHVQALVTRRGGRLFSWTNSKGHSFSDTWAAIVAHAGLPHIERRHMRSTANIRWDRAGGDRELGRWVLGHAARDVNDQHYMRAEPDLIAAAPLVEVPKQYGATPGDAPTQLFLFG